ncbi:hypothetical protein OS965_17000 [Streptomyces sp. H27-G5]|uniref:hypothetical protein n=1 Tax=Streptomyces sp. H27-G5 TaxID=2996698 RepID=UPI00226D7690|nr:hypothetical protein [Streptomyces sp. H27-G5]MCY0919848.1 hypothetical protein [Streptomyces sp. H27-G5]
MPDNEDRASWAAIACQAMGARTGQAGYFEGDWVIEPELLMEIGGDLIGNLFHLAVLNGCDPRQMLMNGAGHFMYELREEIEEAEEAEALAEFEEGFQELENFLELGPGKGE